MLNPELARKLVDERPEMQEFITHVLEESMKLNTIEDIGMVDINDIAVEVLARKRALEKLTEILSPLINIQNNAIMGTTNKDFEM